MRDKFTIGVFGIIFDTQKRVLLCHRRDYDLWNLPGGSVENGESPWEGLKREIKVNIFKLSGVYSKPYKNEVVFAFVCETTGGKLVLTDESNKTEFFSIERLPSNTVPKQVERIKDALANLEFPVLKIQTGKSSIDLVKEGRL